MQMCHFVEYFIGNTALIHTDPSSFVSVRKPVVRWVEDARNVPQTMAVLVTVKRNQILNHYFAKVAVDDWC
jgi:hypothetical protein